MPSKHREESIYQYITRMVEQFPELPYIFQDEYTAGARDCKHVFFSDELTFYKREKLAMELIEVLKPCLLNQTVTEALRKSLEHTPLYLYYQNLTNRIELLLSERLIDETLLYTFAIKLATESQSVKEVKLGILILRFYENDFTRKIIKVLGFHSEFTLYAIEAVENFRDYNQFLFTFVQNTTGFGKLAALIKCKPIHPEQQKWFFHYGAVNPVAPNLSAMLCFTKPDMREFYKQLVVTRETFPELSYLIAYACEDNDVKVFEESFDLIKKYMDTAPTYANTFIDLVAVCTIHKSMEINWQQGETTFEHGWTFHRIEQVHEQCFKLLKKRKWKKVLDIELSQPKEKTSLIMLVINELNLIVEYKKLRPMLNRDFFHMAILKYVLIDHPEHYWKNVLNDLEDVLPKEIFVEKPLDIKDDEITKEYIPDIWLVYLLKALKNEDHYDEPLFIRCLTCRFPDARIEAIKGLRYFKSEWSALVEQALAHAYTIEPNKNIKKRLLRLMGKADQKPVKEQRYVDVDEIKVFPSRWDIRLMTTKIAGIYYRDLSVVEGLIEKGDILYLKREPENPYDEKAILVTAEDGYVLGYVPKADNEIPSSLMNSGEKLYAIFQSEYIEYGKAIIQIMISRQPKEAGKIIPFPK